MHQSAGSTRGRGGHAFPQQSCFLLLVNSSLILKPSGASRRSRSTAVLGGGRLGWAPSLIRHLLRTWGVYSDKLLFQASSAETPMAL